MNRQTNREMIFDKFIHGLWGVSGILLFFITFSICADVILRNLTPFSLDWVVEINEYMLFMITFLGAAWNLKTDGHVRIDYIINMLKPKAQVGVDLICSVLGGLSSLTFSYYAGYATWLSIQRETYLIKFLKVPKYYFTFVMFICTLLLLVVFVRKGFYQYRVWRANKNPELKKVEEII